MAKVFTSEEFINKLKWLVNSVPNVYYSGSNWSKLNSAGKWQFDCVLSIKCILWGFKADKNLYRGGTQYKSNGVADFTCNGGLDYCTSVSKDFRKLVAGEYLCMKDTKYNHSGVYIGNGKVFECTTAWGTKKCIISDISKDGTRSLNGVKNLKWTYHGKLNYIDYEEKPVVPFLPERGYFKQGDKGENVEKINDFLSKKVQGNYYGDYTTNCVKVFQQQNGLVADGCIGPITLQKMIDDGFKE